jgi:hypothetical protein
MQTLTRYELLHRATGAIRDHLLESEHRMPLEAVLDGLLALGSSYNLEAEMLWVAQQAGATPLLTER